MFNLFKKQKQPQPVVSPRRKPISQIFYQEKAVKLPPNFAQNIMELQMQLQFTQTYSMDVVKQLNEMYTIAIEYYINENPKKVNHFQRKLTSLLTNPQTLELMDSNSKSSAKKSQEQLDSQKKAGQYNKVLKKQLLKFNTESQIVVKSLLDNADKKVQRNHKLIQNYIQSQESKLKHRLQQRSRSKKH